MFENLLNPIFDPLLKINGLLAITIISFLVSLIIILIYKFTTDQNLMKQLKDEQAAFQKEMKELKNHPERAMQVQKKAMDTNMKYMMQSFKPTLFTFLPIIIIFGWLNLHFAYLPIMPNEEFTTTISFDKGVYSNINVTVPEGLELLSDKSREVTNGQVNFVFKAKDEGEYTIDYDFNGKLFSKEVLITTDPGQYRPVLDIIKKDGVSTIAVSNKKNIVIDFLGIKLGWLGSYIIFSIIFSMLLRKWMKIY